MTALITREELRSAIEAGSVTVVDALGGEYYAKQHLPGAIALVEAEVGEKAAELLPDRAAPIVTYCSNPACPNGQRVADRLTALGYGNVRNIGTALRTGLRRVSPQSPDQGIRQIYE